jgi:hypothetical protein
MIILLLVPLHITHELDTAVQNITLSTITVKFRMKVMSARILTVKSEMLARRYGKKLGFASI